MNELRDLEAEMEAKKAEDRARSEDRQSSDIGQAPEPVDKDNRLAEATSPRAYNSEQTNGSALAPASKAEARKVWVATDKVAEDELHVVVWDPPPMMQRDSMDAGRKYRKKNSQEPLKDMDRKPEGLTWEELAAKHISVIGDGEPMPPKAAAAEKKRKSPEPRPEKPLQRVIALHEQLNIPPLASQAPPPSKRQCTPAAKMSRADSLPGRIGSLFCQLLSLKQANMGVAPEKSLNPKQANMSAAPQPAPPDAATLLKFLLAGAPSTYAHITAMIRPPAPAYFTPAPPQLPYMSASQQQVYWAFAALLAQQGSGDFGKPAWGQGASAVPPQQKMGGHGGACPGADGAGSAGRLTEEVLPKSAFKPVPRQNAGSPGFRSNLSIRSAPGI